MSDLTTSIKEIFNERISSPFYGSLIVSWLLWNWEIPYVTFFIDQSRLGDSINKIDYIFKHCDSWMLLLVAPLLSTGAIIFLLPYLTNYASKITAKFDRKRKDAQIEINRTQLLTIDQSVKILRQLEEQENSFKILLSSRDTEIDLLKKQLESALKVEPTSKNKDLQNLLNSKAQEIKELQEKLNALRLEPATIYPALPPDSKTVTDLMYAEELDRFLKNENLTKWFDRISRFVQDQSQMYNNVPNDVQNYYLANDLIERAAKGYKFTEKGKYFLKHYTNKKFEQTA